MWLCVRMMHNFVEKNLSHCYCLRGFSKYWQITEIRDATAMLCYTVRYCALLDDKRICTFFWHAIDFDTCLTCGMAMITFHPNWHLMNNTCWNITLNQNRVQICNNCQLLRIKPNWKPNEQIGIHLKLRVDFVEYVSNQSHIELCRCVYENTVEIFKVKRRNHKHTHKVIDFNELENFFSLSLSISFYASFKGATAAIAKCLNLERICWISETSDQRSNTEECL